MNKVAFISFALPFVIGIADAAEIVAPADRRFSQEATANESPSFQRHVLPLLGRLGCNGRACHGSFQGQGGFRLSLFGYDFAADHEALMKGDEPRVNREKPAESLMLQKPTLAIDHEGGKRLEADGWQYRLLRRWIEEGAKPVGEEDTTFVSLEVEPREIVFVKAGDAARLKVIALWSDGTKEDVTPLARFRSNDDSTATVDVDGRITAVDSGDTEIVAFYDNGVAPVQVLLPVTAANGSKYPSVPIPTKIDELVAAKLRKLGIVPSELCTDEEFLRRVSLDMTGTLPSADEVREFAKNNSPDKRADKIDELLARPTYAAWWTNRLCDLTGNSSASGPLGGERRLNDEKSRQWYQWIHRRVRDNVPYDQLVEGIVLAVSRGPERSFEDYCQEMVGYFRRESPTDFSQRETMPYYWSRKTVGKPEDRALAFAHSFLGVSLQCAQCHKHPFDQWTKQDFDQFTAFFSGMRFGDSLRDREQAKEMCREVGLTGDQDSGDYARRVVELAAAGKLQPFKELSVPTPKKTANRGSGKGKENPKLSRVITPRLLGGEEFVEFNYADPRQPVMDWMRQEDNPYFARAFVNRVWAGYFHRGLIEPTDDLNLANPPSHPELLDYLTERFIAGGYDMRALHREIAGSRTYQLSWRPNETNRDDERNLSRAVLRRLPAEVTYDAVTLATASDEERKALDADPTSSRAIGIHGGTAEKLPANYALNLFGKPPRAINCDCERSSEPSLLQTVYLRNDGDIWNRLSTKKGWLAQVKQEKQTDTDAWVREAYLRTVNRLPNGDEMRIATEHFAASEDAVLGLRSLLWALLNTKEFLLNH